VKQPVEATSESGISLSRRKFLQSTAVLPALAAVGSGLALTACGQAAIEPAGEIVALSAQQLSSAIKARQLSCVEVMESYLQQIDRLNGTFNAIVARADSDQLVQQAMTADKELAAGRYRGWMHGFPHAVKDLADAKGFVTSKGSPLYTDNLASVDSLHIARIREAGAIFVGKTNTPEFGLGSQSYNTVFGATLNAWDAFSTAGGSSGGAAVALALRMVPVADGSDMMGSLRNPAGFNNVIGFRPSPGRVPFAPMFLEQLPTNGPMARNVSDTAQLMATMAGPAAQFPNTVPGDSAEFSAPLARDWQGTRLGWLGDFDGYLPMEAGVLSLCERALGHFQTLGAEVEPATLNYSMAELWQTWLTFRHWIVRSTQAANYADPARRALMKPEAIWEVEGGLALTAEEVFNASLARAKFYAAMVKAFERYDFLVLPTAQIFPFDASMHWPKEIAGRSMDTYHRWMEVVIPGTLSGCPVLNVPAGFGRDGLPMGLQIIGPRYADFATLQLGYAYEQAARYNLDQHSPALGL